MVGEVNMDVEGIGDLPCMIQGEFYLFKEVRYIPCNPECSLGLTALKTRDDFVDASHDVGTSLTLCTPSDSFEFLSKQDMMYKHLMDYLPIQLNLFPQTQDGVVPHKIRQTRSPQDLRTRYLLNHL